MSLLLRILCLLCRIEGNGYNGIGHTRHSIFVKGKGDLEMLPLTHYALELHIKRPNYQARIWLQTDHAIMNLENEPSETIGWQEGTDELDVV